MAKTPKLDLIGKTFGRLTVLDEYIPAGSVTKWKCRCECGNETYVHRGKLLAGTTKSCGCIAKSLNGLSDHILYSKWWSIKERCYKEYHPSYKNYGAKGVRLCEEWQDFMAFFNWSMANGFEDGLTIERKDASGDYSPENCEWITLAENVARSNRTKPHRKTQFLYYGIAPDGTRFTFSNASQFGRENNLNSNCIRRVARGERSTFKGWKFGFTDEKNEQ